VDTFAHRDDIHDLHIAQVCFGGDVGLQPGAERFTEKISEDCEYDRDWYQPDTPKGGFGSSKRRPGKGRGENRRGDEVGATARMDGESAFAGVESVERFLRRRLYIFHFKITKQEKAGWVGMPCHVLVLVFMREHVKRGMFERVVSSRFKDEGEIQQHVMIIHAMNDIRHTIFDTAL